MRILIAEDDLTSRRVLALVLKKAGHEVVETTNGAEAWKELQKPDAPKLVILDWMMPKMDGLEVVNCVRGLNSDNPAYIIMLTSKSEKADVITGLNAGADDYLIKPFDLGELRARVEVGRRMIDMQAQLARQYQELRQAMDHIKTLQGILPICSFCKKIRDDKGYWDQVEVYVCKHSNAEFSHSICPECMKKHFPEAFEDDTEDPGGAEG